MKKIVKILIKNKFVRKMFIFLLSFFYDKKYLRGKYFEEFDMGFKWALKGIIYQKIFRFNSNIPWPMSPFSFIFEPKNLEFHVDDLNNFQSFGCYFQNFKAKIVIGKGSYIAPNVGIITANHDIYNLDKHDSGKDVIIGNNCWIGMNSVILPGVVLGDRTIVGAGSVVTKSFEEGNCVIAGNPAKIIKKL